MLLPAMVRGESLPLPEAAKMEGDTQASLFNPSLRVLASFTEEDFRQFFARSPIKRVKYRGWLRNLCVAMGNSKNPQFIPWLESAAEHPDPMIREHAAWAMRRLQAEG